MSDLNPKTLTPLNAAARNGCGELPKNLTVAGEELIDALMSRGIAYLNDAGQFCIAPDWRQAVMGFWLEDRVAEALSETGADNWYANVRVRIPEIGENEYDMVAVWSGRMILISCKARVNFPYVEHIGNLSDSARNRGGTFAKGVVVTAQPFDKHSRERREANGRGITLIDASQLGRLSGVLREAFEEAGR
jgi:hypothetical protein